MDQRSGERTDDGYCGTRPSAPAPVDTGPSYATCVLCGKPTEHPETTKGSTLCPVCAWQEAGRTACAG
ncbi:hypothetical protein [Streptomyces griseus]|uniref:hypothetical protein n=1 Tax=Streptomyces griseus TaxID=1911 RepID=UPI0008407DFD|nr:hypothetical protein [Streptomyces griseus]